MGGPRPKKKSYPKKLLVNKKVVKDPSDDIKPEVIVLSSDGEKKYIDHYKEIDPILEEDKDFNFDVVLGIYNYFVCDICRFLAKTKRGLAIHKSWKHPTEDS
jgi:hypothetical protein